MPADAEAFRAALQKRLSGRSDSDAKFLFLGLLNQHLPVGAEAVLVGGSLVELYTLGATTSMDLDLIGDRRVVFRFLREAGFEADGRYMVHPQLPLVLEMPGGELRPTEAVVTIEFEGLPIKAVSLEDCIVDRLLAARFWQSAVDWEQAIILAEAGKDRIDWDAIQRKAAANQAQDVAEELHRTLTD